MTQGQAEPSFTQWTPKWPSNWHTDDSETLRAWLTTLRTISCQLNIPSFPYKEEAARIIRQKRKQLFRSQRFGKNKKEAIAALLHIVLKKYNKLQPLKMICEELSLDYRLVSKYLWTMESIVGAGRRFSAKDYLQRYAWKVTGNLDVIKKAEQLLTAVEREISGNPISIAAGALFLISKKQKLKLSNNEIGDAFHISGRTVYSNKRRLSQLVNKRGFKL
jgi:transcription initiation factor TFIIIB Brf1 subunit/transcription initiation factor TFIIB